MRIRLGRGSREEETFAGRSEAWKGPQERRKSSASGNKAWEGVTGESTGNKGLAGTSNAWEERDSPISKGTSGSEAWKGSREERRSFAGRSKA